MIGAPVICDDDFHRSMAKEDCVAIRFISLIACLVTLLALNTGVSVASPGPTGVATATQPTAFCPAQRGAGATSTQNRVALRCHCCGRDENGHCNHQCCTD